MAKKDGKALHLFERICVQLIFLLSAFLILFLGIRAAGSTIDFAQSERIEIINNLVETVVYRYLEAFVRAVAGFEFVPRNDFTVLTQIINSLPDQTQVLSFVYHGRDLTIRTAQPSPAQVMEMAERLEENLRIPEEFENVVYSYYIDEDQQCIAQITLVARRYDETNLVEELQKEFLPEDMQPDGA